VRANQSQFRGDELKASYVLLGAVPGLAWVLYFYWKDGRGSSSFHNIARVFLCGCACTIPAALVEHVTDARVDQETLLRAGMTSFFLIAPIEEFFKLLAVWVTVYRSRDFNDPFQGLIFAVTAALGFASVENIVYMGFLGPSVIVLRAAFATPAHVMFSCMWGYSMGLARFRRDREIWTIFKGFLAAILLHGFYNFLVAVHPRAGVILLIPLMGFMGWLMYRLVRNFRLNHPFSPIGKGALIECPICGALTLEGEMSCARCGAAIPLMETDAPRFCGTCRALLDPARGTCPRCGEKVVHSNTYAPLA